MNLFELAQQYHFFTASDDGSVMFVDINKDGDFTDAGERVVNNNLYQGTQKRGTGVPGDPALPQELPPVLAPGLYNVYMAMYEGGGGASIHASWAFGDFAIGEEIIPLISSTATLTNPVNVTANATINTNGSGLNVALGPLTVSNGVTLNKAGGGTIGFSQSTVGATSTFNVTGGSLDTGGLKGTGNVTVNKTGSGRLNLNSSTGSTIGSGSTFNVTGGTLAVAAGGTSSATNGGAISLAGTLELRGDIGLVAGLQGGRVPGSPNPTDFPTFTEADLTVSRSDQRRGLLRRKRRNVGVQGRDQDPRHRR